MFPKQPKTKRSNKPTRLKLSPAKYRQLKEYVLLRDNYSCVCCGTNSSTTPHHIVNRSHFGEDSPKNIVTLCVECHDYVEQGRIELPGYVKEMLAGEPDSLAEK